MTRKEAERLTHQENALLNLGFTREEADALRRISNTLHRWHEHECNGTIQRDGENGDERPYWYNPIAGHKGAAAPDRETGALTRLAAIIKARNERECDHSDSDHGEVCKIHDVRTYVQGDPRGAALYIIRPGDVPEGGDVRSYYTYGICVY